MTLNFTVANKEDSLKKIERDLLRSNPSLNITRFKRMTPHRLSQAIEKINESENNLTNENNYGSWLHNPRFFEMKMLREWLGIVKDIKEEEFKKDTLIPNFMYYRSVKKENGVLNGYRCLCYEADEYQDWVPFKSNEIIEKAYTLCQFGSDEDFKKIYIEEADGRADALFNIQIEHISESSNESLKRIGLYCDNRWEGPWPWEIKTSPKMKHKIEENRTMRKISIAEARSRFDHIVSKNDEGEMSKYAVIAQAKDLAEKVQGMIEDLGKLAGEGMITLKDNARTSIGDNAAEHIEQEMSGPLNHAADTLSKLRAHMENAIKSLEGNDMENEEGMEDETLGPPGDVIGGDVADSLADVDLSGDDGERAMKDM